MKHFRLLIASICAVMLLAVVIRLSLKMAADDSTQATAGSNQILSTDAQGFAQVFGPREFIFPEDHAAHNQYRTEWWYFTGNVQDAAARQFGYELTFFRLALTANAADSPSSWRNEQIYMAHFAVTDVDSQRFYVDERFSRAGNRLAGAKQGGLHVWLYNWSAIAEQADTSKIRLTAGAEDFSIQLQLQPLKPLVLQGQQGYSRKNPEPGNASYYYSYTRLATQGTIVVAGKSFDVTGLSWMDREWSSSALSAQQIGWDWFALQLSDDSELMFYRFRRKDGAPDKNSAGTLFLGKNSRRELKYDDVVVTVSAHWVSPVSGINYPILWRLAIPDSDLQLQVTPLIKNQELNVSYRYWEGAVRVSGTKNGQPISGQGYVEMTGYD